MVLMNVPRRYIIRFKKIDGEEFEYPVVTWFGETRP